MAPRASSIAQVLRQAERDAALPAYCVLAGDEILLVNEAADALRALATQLGCSERSHLVMDARSDWSAVLAAACNTSLFGDLRLVEISLPSGKPGKAGADMLQRLADQAAAGQLPDAFILLRLPQLDWATQKSKWVQHLKKQATWVAIPGVARPDLPGWIAQRLARQQQAIDAATQAWLAGQVEGNLLAAHQEIEKLGLLYPPGALSLEQVQAAVLDVSRHDPQDLRAAVLVGEPQRALRVLAGLKAEGMAHLPVLWGLGEDLRILGMLANLPAAQRGGALRAQRVFGAREQHLRQALQRCPARLWPLALGQAHEIDRHIKGVPVAACLPDPWDELARLVLRVATAGKPPPDQPISLP
ncbi:DNA polymerase III subunit delta [Castellaniella sp.]|uniref:DNA polymerase III subunit delta n=1 Tax=Castellaniella sp. TaxID=1955812 RepID=UPI0035697064